MNEMQAFIAMLPAAILVFCACWIVILVIVSALALLRVLFAD
ncbi:MAG: hypothetical protein SF123_10880 [Chloroflexota bacterium]|nr:hypothetical protein [Chloroflexota bacterium]